MPVRWGVSRTMGLKAAQQSQLLSAHAMIAQYRREMGGLVRQGRPPAGSSARLRPLPQAEAEALLRPLAALQTRLREAVWELTGDDPEATQRTQSLHATRIWAANILDRIRDTIASVEPERLAAKYGGLSEANAETLGRLNADLDDLLQEAMRALAGPDR